MNPRPPAQSLQQPPLLEMHNNILINSGLIVKCGREISNGPAGWSMVAPTRGACETSWCWNVHLIGMKCWSVSRRGCWLAEIENGWSGCRKMRPGEGEGEGEGGGVAQQRPRMNGPMAAEFERAPNQLAHWSIRWWIRWKVTLVVAPLVEGAWTCWFVRVVSPLNGWHPVAYSLSTSWLSFLRFPFSFHFYFSVFISQIEIYIDIHFCLVVSSFVLSYQLIVAQCDGRDSEKFHHLSIEERRGVCVR